MQILIRSLIFLASLFICILLFSYLWTCTCMFDLLYAYLGWHTLSFICESIHFYKVLLNFYICNYVHTQTHTCTQIWNHSCTSILSRLFKIILIDFPVPLESLVQIWNYFNQHYQDINIALSHCFTQYLCIILLMFSV